MVLSLTDFALWALLYFPVITGGVWIYQPGLKVELSELSVPTIICALFIALSVKLKGPKAVYQLSSVRIAMRVWNFWEGNLDEKPKRTLLSFVAITGMLFSFASLRRHWAFGSGAFDLGIYSGALWNLTHGLGYISSFKEGINLFQDHQNPTFWVFAPLFKVFPYVETLLILQGLIIAAGAIPLYFLSRQYSPEKRWFHAALPLLYVSYLPLRNANAFDFHPEVLMLPLFLSAIVGLQSKIRLHQILGGVALLLALGCKESAGPVAAGVGLAWMFGAAPPEVRKRCQWMGSLVLLMGCGFFILDTKIIPAHFGWQYAYQNNYATFGASTLDILASPFLKPKVFWSHLFGLSRILFLFMLLAPFAFLPVSKRRAFITCLCAASPGFLLIALTDGDYRVRIIYHYVIEPAVGVFFALPIAFSELKDRDSLRVKLIVIFCTLVFFGRSELYRIRIHRESSHQAWLSEKLLPALPTSLSVAANGSIGPHLINRFWIHQIPFIEMPGGKTVDCIVYDTAENTYPLGTHEVEGFLQKVKELRYREVYRCGSLTVFQNGSASNPASLSSCLPVVVPCQD